MTEEQIVEEIQARFRHWCDTEIELDMEAWAQVVTEDVVLQPAGAPAVRGKEAATAYCGDLLRSMGIVALDPFDTTVLVSPGSDVAASFGAFRVVADSGDGPQEFTMKAMVAWRRVNGEWLVAANSWSGNE